MQMMKKKGQSLMNTGSGTIGIIFGLFVLVVMLFSFAIAAGELNDTGDTDDNTSTIDNPQTVISDGLSGLTSFSGLLSAIFVIAGIALLIAILVMAVGGVMNQ
jgi:hypothetical protein